MKADPIPLFYLLILLDLIGQDALDNRVAYGNLDEAELLELFELEYASWNLDAVAHLDLVEIDGTKRLCISDGF